MKKKAKLALAPVAAGSIASLIGGLFFYKNYVLRPQKPTELKPAYQALLDQLTAKRQEETWSFTSFDGLQLKANFYPGDADSHVYAVLVHGYHDTAYRMLPHAVHFMDQGYHILMPHLRGHGDSEGGYVGFGYHDHFDILGFVDMIRERDPQAQIFLLGISMGAATVMMASGEYLPSNVKCIIEDCGYTSAWEQCKYNMRTMYHLPAFPVLTLTNLFMKYKLHYSLREASPLKAVTKATVPMLFIHGAKDDFVPFYMEQYLYEACGSKEKEFLVVPGAVHARSNEENPQLYWSTVDAFLEKHL